MGKYQAYPEYKSSGVDILGEIPSTWSIWKLNHFAPIITCGVAATPEYVDDGVVFLSAQNVKHRKIDLSKGYKFISKQKHEELTKNREPKNGDILLSRVGTVGEACIIDVDFPFSIFVSLTHLRLDTSICTNEFFVWLCESAYVKGMHGIVTLVGGGVGNLNVNDLREYQLPIPLLEEQQKIANFLDHETAKIDTLIEKQQQLIQLLKEKRQAVISHAVTKGLNPNAPMKDSGVEWLGEVPEHWEVAPIRRHLLEHRQGYYTTEDYVDTGIKLLRITDLRDLGNLSIDDCPRVLPNDSLKNFMLREGDVVFARTGGAGSFGVFPSISESVAYASYLIRFRFLPQKFNTGFLKYMLFADSFQLAVKQKIHGGVNQNIHAEDIKNTLVASPPLVEQQEISDYLDRQVNKYAELISAAEIANNLMQERRTALISAAVTGKIDVRNFSARLT